MLRLIYLIFFFCCSPVSSQINNIYYHKAIKNSSNGNNNLALENIERAIKLAGSKSLPLFYLHKYEYLVKLEKLDGALVTLNQAIDLYPSSILLLNARAEFYLALRKYDYVIQEYNKIIPLTKSEEELADYEIKLASTYFMVRKFDEAALNLKNAFKRNSSNTSGLNLLALLNIESRNFNEAKRILQILIKNDTNDFSAINNLGFMYQKINQHQEAISLFNEVLRLNHKNPSALCNRAYSYLQTSNIKQALSDVNTSLSMMQSNSYAYMVRGKIYLALKQVENACFDFAFAKKLNFSEQYGNEVDDLIISHCNKYHFLN